jgi:hypothetical protein
VTVTISGDRPPVRRTVQTDANGRFLFEYLLPGEYALLFEQAGTASLRRLAVIEVGRDTQVDVVLGLTVQEQVTVTAARPLVDVRSPEVSFNFTAETLNSLPLERTYQGLFQLIPGVADNRSNVGPAAGGSRQDNSYLIDGVKIGNPAFGHLATDVNELDIAEVNLKRAGISAEFGRTAGSVTNAVSRSGTNELRGIGRMDWLPPSFISEYELPSELTAAGVRPGVFQDRCSPPMPTRLPASADRSRAIESSSTARPGITTGRSATGATSRAPRCRTRSARAPSCTERSTWR